jgi:hypothetical protein
MVSGWVAENKRIRKQQRIHVVPRVEEIRAKLKALAFMERKRLKERKVPALEARATNDVASSIAKGSQHRIGSKVTLIAVLLPAASVQ